MRVTARREPREAGLAGVVQGPRGYIIKCNGKDVGRVSALFAGFGKAGTRGWYFYASAGDVRINTCNDAIPFATAEEARDACIAWVKEHA